MVNRIKIARIEKNLTQKDLASKVNVTRQTIGLIEAGKYNPSLKLCIDIAKTLDKTLDELFWEREK
ncbi:PbsX family transcriptional regulator [Priestia megaterium]|uniref:helix-turn-helix transcriptional regulator n=1 Tax=Priestia megaterium TaxID=1404 RepID=UPI000E1B4A99|nr:helix-turn-helix transcriptional regulator [Priestia megaterium]SSY69846.1 PbsX family transcriptional regulator [Priestia megaterium]